MEKIRYEELDYRQKKLFDMMPSKEQENYLQNISLEKRLKGIVKKTVNSCNDANITIKEFGMVIRMLESYHHSIQEETLSNTKL